MSLFLSLRNNPVHLPTPDPSMNERTFYFPLPLSLLYPASHIHVLPFLPPPPHPPSSAECPLYLSRAELEASEGCKPSTPADVEAEDAALAGGSASDVVVAGLAGKDLPRGTRRGLALLKRSVGVMVARELELFKSPPPPGWGPLATFTAVCSALSRDAAAAAKQPHPATAAASSSHAASRVAGGAGPSQSRHQEHAASAAGSGGSHMATSVAG